MCEPALGSGAFAIEATRQLAEKYLERREAELGLKIDPDEYTRKLQRAKAYIALHNVYGVDLNPTAVELAEISLWLDTMVAGLDAPWFGLHLRSGNSLIGARSAVYSPTSMQKRGWLKIPAAPFQVQAATDEGIWTPQIGDGIFHFLLPADGWGASGNAKTAKELAPERAKDLRDWARQIKGQPTRQQLTILRDLSHRVERLWRLAATRLEIAESQSRRPIPVWEHRETAPIQSVSREQIEEALSDPNGAYQRLRLVMDAWSAMWFWPITDRQLTVETGEGTQTVKPPSLDRWLQALTEILGSSGKKEHWDNTFLMSDPNWGELEAIEENDLGLAGASKINTVLEEHPWLQVTQRVARDQRFFHWDLDFAPVFAKNGGFDLQVGNPPWVRPTYDEDMLLAEGDPWWQLVDKPTQTIRKERRELTLSESRVCDGVVEGSNQIAGQASFMGAESQFPHLKGLQPDTYRCFMEETWKNMSARGIVSLIHPESHFTDDKAGPLRQATYGRLRRHWQFLNEKQLFTEIHHLVSYGIHVYGQTQERVNFDQAVSLYVPETAERSLRHSGGGQEPGLKDPEGNWDTRPHRDRIENVNPETLELWAAVTGSTVPSQTPMIYAVNQTLSTVLQKISKAERVRDAGFQFSAGFHETSARKEGLFDVGWGAPASWDDVILQGPHLHVGNPSYKYPNETMKHNQDWHFVDLEQLPTDSVPVTAYKRSASKEVYDSAYTDWGTPGRPNPARAHYRVAWRVMAANTGERTLIPGLFPPGSTHVDAVSTAAGQRMAHTVSLLAFSSAITSDLMVRSVGKGHIRVPSIERLPLILHHPLTPHLHLRTLRLNAVTSAYADLWVEVYDPAFEVDGWAGGRGRPNRPGLGEVTSHWSELTPLRLAEDRRQALIEIDAIVAVMLGVTADELATVYRTAFPVLYGYDKNRDHYDANGRLVPKPVLDAWKKEGDGITAEQRTATNASGYTYTYELPFMTLDREQDLRDAHAHFAALVAGDGNG